MEVQSLYREEQFIKSRNEQRVGIKESRSSLPNQFLSVANSLNSQANVVSFKQSSLEPKKPKSTNITPRETIEKLKKARTNSAFSASEERNRLEVNNSTQAILNEIQEEQGPPTFMNSRVHSRGEIYTQLRAGIKERRDQSDQMRKSGDIYYSKNSARAMSKYVEKRRDSREVDSELHKYFLTNHTNTSSHGDVHRLSTYQSPLLGEGINKRNQGFLSPLLTKQQTNISRSNLGQFSARNGASVMVITQKEKKRHPTHSISKQRHVEMVYGRNMKEIYSRNTSKLSHLEKPANIRFPKSKQQILLSKILSPLRVSTQSKTPLSTSKNPLHQARSNHGSQTLQGDRIERRQKKHSQLPFLIGQDQLQQGSIKLSNSYYARAIPKIERLNSLSSNLMRKLWEKEKRRKQKISSPYWTKEVRSPSPEIYGSISSEQPDNFSISAYSPQPSARLSEMKMQKESRISHTNQALGSSLRSYDKFSSRKISSSQKQSQNLRNSTNHQTQSKYLQHSPIIHSSKKSSAQGNYPLFQKKMKKKTTYQDDLIYQHLITDAFQRKSSISSSGTTPNQISSKRPQFPLKAVYIGKTRYNSGAFMNNGTIATEEVRKARQFSSASQSSNAYRVNQATPSFSPLRGVKKE